MCFSAEASFLSGAALAISGGVMWRRTPRNELRWIAVIPLFFALQQIAEGVVWLHLHPWFERTVLSWSARTIYLLFAYVVWLVYLPLAMWRLERIQWRRWLCLFFCLGAIPGAIQNTIGIVSAEWTPSVMCHSVDYLDTKPSDQITYGVVVFVPLLVSSLPQMRLYSITALLFYGLSYLFYLETFTSVWCFFAAVSSILIYQVIRINTKTSWSRSPILD